jgi:hypothetical protein
MVMVGLLAITNIIFPYRDVLTAMEVVAKVQKIFQTIQELSMIKEKG